MKKKPGDLDVQSDVPVPQYPIESVDKALRILLLLGERSELRLTEVSEYLGVASSTAHRLMAMLQYRGFMRQDAKTKVYRPGTALTGVAFSILQRFDVRETLHPLLEQLNLDLAETVHLAFLDGTTVRFIDAIESPRAVRVASRLGKSMPAHCTSTGKAILSTLSSEELRRLYPDDALPALTPNSLTTRTDLEEDLARSARRGFATSHEESESGVGSVAVAFPPRQTPMRLAVNVSVPVSRFGQAEIKRISEAMKAGVAQSATLLH